MRWLTLFMISLGTSSVAAQEKFATNTIDIGVVVSDIEKSVSFYRDALGMKESGAFTVDGDFAAKVGLTDGRKLDVRVLTLGDGPTVTKLKLMQVSGDDSQKSRNDFIHSTLGFSYLTISVVDTEAAVQRLTKAGVKTLKASPLPLPAPLPSHLLLTMVRDPDGNFIELVGPKK